jgi:hypothetical protein
VHRTQEPGSGDSANAPLGCILAGDPKKKGRIGRDTLIWPHRDAGLTWSRLMVAGVVATV